MKKYIVVEVEDIEKYLNEKEQLIISNLIEKMRDGRQSDDKSRTPEIQHEINGFFPYHTP